MTQDATDRATTQVRRNRYDEILAIGIELISERGYAATTLRDVADRVGILKGSLYHYFPSKEALLFRILEETHDRAMAQSDEITAMGLSAGDELFTYLRLSCLSYLDHVDQANIYFTEARELTGDRRAKIRKYGDGFESRLRDRVARAQAAGEITGDQTTEFITAFLIGSSNSVRGWRIPIAGARTNAEASAQYEALMRRALAAS